MFHDCGPLWHAMIYARRLAIVALPADGELWQALQPSMGGSALDAHMAVLLVGLAICEHCARTEDPNPRNANLADVIALLEPGEAGRLRTLFPIAYTSASQVPELRAADAERLADADWSTFEWWRLAAHTIAAGALERTAELWGEHDHLAHLQRVVLVSDPYPQNHDDDATWYLPRLAE